MTPNTLNEATERERFETAMLAAGYDDLDFLIAEGSDRYFYNETRLAFAGWLAKADAQPTETPEQIADENALHASYTLTDEQWAEADRQAALDSQPTSAETAALDALLANSQELERETAAGVAGEVVAWDVFEHRLYGAPGEKSHRVLWVENYRLADGSMPDLDVLLEAARSGGICKSVKTIHIMPLYTHPASHISAAAQAVPTTGGADHV